MQKSSDPSGLGLYEDETVRADSNLQHSPKIAYITSTQSLAHKTASSPMRVSADKT